MFFFAVQFNSLVAFKRYVLKHLFLFFDLKLIHYLLFLFWYFIQMTKFSSSVKFEVSHLMYLLFLFDHLLIFVFSFDLCRLIWMTLMTLMCQTEAILCAMQKEVSRLNRRSDLRWNLMSSAVDWCQMGSLLNATKDETIESNQSCCFPSCKADLTRKCWCNNPQRVRSKLVQKEEIVWMLPLPTRIPAEEWSQNNRRELQSKKQTVNVTIPRKEQTIS